MMRTISENQLFELYLLAAVWSIHPVEGELTSRSVRGRDILACLATSLCVSPKEVMRIVSSPRFKWLFKRNLEQQVRCGERSGLSYVMESTAHFFVWRDAVRDTPYETLVGLRGGKTLYVTPQGELQADKLESKYFSMLRKDTYLQAYESVRPNEKKRSRVVWLMLPKDGWKQSEVDQLPVWRSGPEAGRDVIQQGWRNGYGYFRRRRELDWLCQPGKGGVGKYFKVTARHLNWWRIERDLLAKVVTDMPVEPILFIQEEGSESGRLLSKE